MAHDFYTNDGVFHEGIKSVKLPADAGGTETVEYLADNEVTKNEKIQQSKSVTLSTSGVVEPDAGYDAVRSVSVTVQGGGEVEVQPVKNVTLSESGTVTPDDGYDAMASVNVTIPGVEPAPVNISVSAAGVVTAYGDGVTTATHPLSATDDADFVAANIKKNVTIFGVTGTYQPIIPPSGNVTLDVTATTTNYDVGTSLDDVISDITAVLTFPDGETTLEIEDKSLLTAYNLTTEGNTIASGDNQIRIMYGGLYDDITVTGGTITLSHTSVTVWPGQTYEDRPSIIATTSQGVTGSYEWFNGNTDVLILGVSSVADNKVSIYLEDQEFRGDIVCSCSRGGLTAEFTVHVVSAPQ